MNLCNQVQIPDDYVPDETFDPPIGIKANFRDEILKKKGTNKKGWHNDNDKTNLTQASNLKLIWKVFYKIHYCNQSIIFTLLKISNFQSNSDSLLINLLLICLAVLKSKIQYINCTNKKNTKSILFTLTNQSLIKHIILINLVILSIHFSSHFHTILIILFTRYVNQTFPTQFYSPFNLSTLRVIIDIFSRLGTDVS